MEPIIFDAAERAVLGQLADVLIPAADGFPSASQAGVTGEKLDEVLTVRPDLAGPLKKMVSLVEGLHPVKAVAKLEASHPDLFGALTDFVPGAYFLNPTVRAKLAYEGQAAVPIPSPPDHVESELLRPVIDRGPIYRVPPRGESEAG
jgi:hypothetical protein